MRYPNVISIIVPAYVCAALIAGLALADENDAPVPESWHVDGALYPKAYGVLANEKLMYPVDMGDWPVKIDGSHQLFVDDYLIASAQGVERELHHATKCPGNPVMVADKPWEDAGTVFQIVRRDEKTGRFRMWYAGHVRYKLPNGIGVRFPALYAESEDGTTWKKPSLGLHEFNGSKKNNIVIPAGNLFGLAYEPREPDPSRRYKGICWHEPDYVPREGYFLYTSPDGIRWKRESEEPLALSLRGYALPQSGIGDTSIFRWDRLLGKYVCDAKFVLPGKFRCRGMMESDDLIHWTRPRMTIYPDGLDHPDSQIYGHLSFCYESMWLGFLRVMHTHVGWKQTTVELTCSRDGRHWSRAGKRQEVIPLGARSQWDADYHDPCWDPIPVGNELWIYYRSVNRGPDDRNPKVGHVIGLAKLRRDGFASVNAGDEPGTVVTRPLTFQGRALYVNAEAGEGGYVKAEIRTRSGKPLPSHGLDRCEPLATDTVASRVVWAGAQTIDCAGERSVRLAFELKNAKLYSFWIE